MGNSANVLADRHCEVRLVGTPIPPWLQRKMKMECLHAARELVKLLVTHSSDKKHTIRGGNVLW